MNEAPALPVDLDHLRGWVGRTQEHEQRLDPFAARALAALLDHERLPQEGDELPLPWHWLYFLDTPSRAGTGSDGHPLRGGFLPPVPLPRRMWAAGAMQVHRPLVIGRPARKVSTVRDVELKEGKTGPLVFVNVAHELQQDGVTCISEEQNLVYREAPTGPAPLPRGEPAAESAEWSEAVRPDAVMLFRFSALTYNGHRIHYDRDYATGEEFYPGLVVHGPLLATLLLDLLRSRQPDARVRRFEFRALRPAFAGEPLTICGARQDSRISLWTADAQGMVGMRATAYLD